MEYEGLEPWESCKAAFGAIQSLFNQARWYQGWKLKQ
jgi:hypothetical protein